MPKWLAVSNQIFACRLASRCVCQSITIPRTHGRGIAARKSMPVRLKSGGLVAAAVEDGVELADIPAMESARKRRNLKLGSPQEDVETCCCWMFCRAGMIQFDGHDG